MNTENLIKLLEGHLEQTKQGTELYKLRLRRTIDHLKSGFYLNQDEKLIVDLDSLGFVDLGRQIRKGLYV